MRGKIRRQVVAIPSGRDGGDTPMYCVISSPESAPPRPSVLIFSQAGLQNKGGVGDYFRWLADELAAHGHHVLRFDQPGTGDSPGELLQDEPLETYFVEVQKGISTADTEAALKWANEAWPGARIRRTK